MNYSIDMELKHDFYNCLTVIKTITESNAIFIKKLSDILIEKKISTNHVFVFENSMKMIQEETSKMEEIFQKILRD